jgi:O-antigen biosynthesis protein
MKRLLQHLQKGHLMLPDWVFRVGWGTPGVYEYLQLRMEAAQLGTSRTKARKARKVLETRVANLKRPADHAPLRWAIKTSVPAGPVGQGWGDLYFAQEIASSLEKLGHTVRVDLRIDVINSHSAQDDVVLVLRGVERIRPQRGALNLLWIISHPSRISKHELKSFDAVFAASTSWSQKMEEKTDVKITSLLQATNPAKFNPNVSRPDCDHDVLFIGNTRNEFRRIIKDALLADVKPTVYGRNWDRFISADLIGGDFVENAAIATKYRSAGIVLNDHWPDMAREGFYSNRLFDAVASGARVISDQVEGIAEIFQGGVQTYTSLADLGKLCSKENRKMWGSQQEILDRAHHIGERHSFDQRAKVLSDAVKKLI